tara:strand:+ start:205 stop:1206 length:1002 start_codon:yes stop_codon:yes gene_type:complete
MAAPEFSKVTKDTLAKRAAYLCSNPDCRASTAGPGEDANKSVVIGEACHINGAKPGSARHLPTLSIYAAAEPSNGLWLCRNCHKIIDADHPRYPAELLFEWRKIHESFVLEQLGTRSDQILAEKRSDESTKIYTVSPRGWAIAQDRLPGWEFRLTSALLRELLKEPYRRWSELRDGLYTKATQHISDDDFRTWLLRKNSEAMDLVHPIEALYTKHLSIAWGELGQPGDQEKILRTCELISDACNRLIEWEESVQFSWVDGEAAEVKQCMHGMSGRHIEKLMEVPDLLDNLVDWVEENPGEPREMTHTIVFDLPEDWDNRFNRAIKAYRRSLSL